MIKDLLEKLGFSSKEITIYLSLLQRGRLTANQLAAVSKLNRTTTYGILAGLVKKNLVIEDLGSPTSVYVAAPTSNLINFFEKKERETKKQKELATRIASELERLKGNQPFQLAKITFINETEIESYLTHRTQRWCLSLTNYDGVWRGFQDSRLLGHFQEYFDLLYTRLMPKTVSQELISEDMPAELEFEKKYKERRKVKIWQHGYDFTYSTWVVGDYIVMIQAKDHPFYLIEIKDPALAKNLRDLFTGIWKFI